MHVFGGGCPGKHNPEKVADIEKLIGRYRDQAEKVEDTAAFHSHCEEKLKSFYEATLTSRAFVLRESEPQGEADRILICRFTNPKPCQQASAALNGIQIYLQGELIDMRHLHPHDLLLQLGWVHFQTALLEVYIYICTYCASRMPTLSGERRQKDRLRALLPSM